ncbi:sigma-70 family RNA polymerase sigma factor [Nitratireductor indicus]|uniref:ECF subfamily RNA polymerase sigma-24 factor n=1 Tax=Nitratireductor indicus C115 TaxID=1231190 RepID=K2P0V7_9HYPH|nr:sigma-70 family RNA polymerase sigma factor [Nitratireductor indicus]EKF40981.1 ECF subfamily RNA polymerase sigma-24 factor [Nitratireductor indicus C115]MDS1135003.1 sigma-70 family RNA polymerase sigma factor [Nitratireductor indicus]SFQ73597.1 RNA polymerase sigma-70 factor, ECF subfamily [Nitratireductor indicus]
MSFFLDEMEACVPALRRYARALTHDRDRADDLVQDCLERAIRKSSLWRPTGPLRAWLFRILLNLHRNEIRRDRRTPAAFPIDALPLEPPSPAAQTDRLALADTARAMQKLSIEQREALLLVALEGMSYAEAAGVLDIPVGTLMSRVGRARENLRSLTENGQPHLRSIK